MPTKCLFLDRDGTLIRDEHYISDPSKVVIERDAINGLRKFMRSGFRLVVVSNQSGIGRGLITEKDVLTINSKVAELLAQHQIIISSWHFCPHTPSDKCVCRKPATGLFYEAEALHQSIGALR